MKISDMLRELENISGFKRSGIYKDDVERFCDYAHLQTDNLYLVALRLAFWDTVTVHTLTEGVCSRIKNTRIEHLPNGRPDFLKKPFLLEAKEGTLLHNIHTIGGYIDNGVLVILSFYTDGSFLVQTEQNAFSGMAIEDINFKNSTGHEQGGGKNFDILPFITILAIMLEAERTPLVVDGGSKKDRKRNRGKKPNNSSDWIERRIYINAKYLRKTNVSDHIPLDKEGKKLKNVLIQGFFRNQPYGPQHKLRKYIYIDGFESSRWTYGGNTKIIVDIKKTDDESNV